MIGRNSDITVYEFRCLPLVTVAYVMTTYVLVYMVYTLEGRVAGIVKVACRVITNLSSLF